MLNQADGKIAMSLFLGKKFVNIVDEIKNLSIYLSILANNGDNNFLFNTLQIKVSSHRHTIHKGSPVTDTLFANKFIHQKQSSHN